MSRDFPQRDLVLQKYNISKLHFINEPKLIYQQKYQQPNSLISLFLQIQFLKTG